MKKILLLKLLLISSLFSNGLELNNKSSNGLNLKIDNKYQEKVNCLSKLKSDEELYKCGVDNPYKNNSKIIPQDYNIVKESINEENEENEEVVDNNYINKKELIKKCIKEATTKEELEKCKDIR